MNEGLRQALMDFLGDRYAEGEGGVTLSPASERELVAVLRLLRERGGRLHHGVFLSRGRFDAIGAVDSSSACVEVGAGVSLASLERAVNARELSLGPLSPLAMSLDVAGFLEGPWAGLRGVPGGRLESACLALTAMMADGLSYQSRPSPRSAAGPDLDACFLGGEGRMGLVLRATLRLFPRPTTSRHVVYSFPDAPSARRALQAGLAEGVWLAQARAARRNGRVLVELQVVGQPDGVERDLSSLSHEVFSRGGRASGHLVTASEGPLPERELPWEALPDLLAQNAAVTLHRLSLASFVACAEALPLPPPRPPVPAFLAALHGAADPHGIFGGPP